MMRMTGRVRAGIIVPLAVCGLIAPAVPALAAGSNMPWEQPLQQIPQSIEGPVTKVIAAIVIRASGDSFRVAWTERRYENASLTSTARWTAILTVVFDTAHDAERLHRAWCSRRKQRGQAQASQRRGLPMPKIQGLLAHTAVRTHGLAQ